ncbi:hypothetical protein MUK42_21977 [Musa troglodytarum]|uniref:Uncharacterized protein n=1 Tax=Musa troglodytarum TaxID=320322 RepID=A0A9E7KAN0_9LILI|nr:hypothetical protein MUK42_21977 [Musa troglodytarum]
MKRTRNDYGCLFLGKGQVIEKGIRGMARKQRSDFLRHVSKKVSLMSNSWGFPSSPVGSSQSKL